MSDKELLNDDLDEEITVTLELDDGTTVTCAVVTMITLEKQDYVVLLPLQENGDANAEGDIWFYRYHEDENQEPVLDFIEDDDEYERISDAFDEFLDNIEFDEMG
jgi:uncharacterized protein YrzB (UPF0473 family)